MRKSDKERLVYFRRYTCSKIKRIHLGGHCRQYPLITLVLVSECLVPLIIGNSFEVLNTYAILTSRQGITGTRTLMMELLRMDLINDVINLYQL